MILLSLAACKDEHHSPSLSVTGFSPDSGMVGAAVTVNGTGFSASPEKNVLTFNGAAAVVTSAKATALGAIVPDGALTGIVSVSVGGVSATSEASFTVLPAVADDPAFYFGADLSYVNQIVDHGGEYNDHGKAEDPYKIFRDHGTDLVRLRLWHNPVWTKEVYDPDGAQMYNDVSDVSRAIAASRAQGMEILLDFHYSDVWADPGTQNIPAAWLDVKDISVLRDSVYRYTFNTLQRLDATGLMPEFVQLGNEINCGMLYEYNDNPVTGFPACNVCNGQWSNLATVINGAIKAVRDVSANSSIKTKIMLHVADPANVTWWFDNVAGGGVVNDFDIIGFSYYPIWHTGVPLDALSDRIAEFRTRYGKDVMILEAAYPWTASGADSYNNAFGSQTPINGYPYTPQGQLDMMKKITQEVVDGGGAGVVYWEPAWISAPIRDLWNTGSSWENCAFFDFDGNVLPVMDYMKYPYDR